jgi:hypothetical protein
MNSQSEKKLSLTERIRRAREQHGLWALFVEYRTQFLAKIGFYDLWGTIRGFLFRPRLDLQGWFGPANQRALERVLRGVARPGMRVLEIGTWKGLSTSVIARVVKEQGGTVYCVDTWAGNVGVGGAHKQVLVKDVFAVFRDNMKLLGVWGVIRPIYMDSAAAHEVLKDDFFDFIFIDADHRYEGVRGDLLRYLPKLKRGGIVCGDDCEAYYRDLPAEFVEQNCNVDFAIHNGRGYHAGVVKALHEFWGADYQLEPGASFWSKRVENPAVFTR